MNTFLDASELGEAAASAESIVDPFDTSVYFGRWLNQVGAGQELLTPESTETPEEENSEIYLDCFPGSNCEVTFEGVLHLEGHSSGSISSSFGTLVLTPGAHIEGDINVGVALINGCVTGNITATERVVLNSEARVMGRIRTPSLSVRVGAAFDGDCLVTGTAQASGLEPSLGEKQSDEPKYLAVGAAA